MGDAPTASTSCVGLPSSSAADTAEVVIGENVAAAKEGSGYHAADCLGDSTKVVSAAWRKLPMFDLANVVYPTLGRPGR